MSMQAPNTLSNGPFISAPIKPKNPDEKEIKLTFISKPGAGKCRVLSIPIIVEEASVLFRRDDHIHVNENGALFRRRFGRISGAGGDHFINRTIIVSIVKVGRKSENFVVFQQPLNE